MNIFQNIYVSGVDLLAMTLVNENQDIFHKVKEIIKNNFYDSILGRITIIHIASALGKTDYLNVLRTLFPNYLNTPVEKSGKQNRIMYNIKKTVNVIVRSF